VGEGSPRSDLPVSELQNESLRVDFLRRLRTASRFPRCARSVEMTFEASLYTIFPVMFLEKGRGRGSTPRALIHASPSATAIA
jgi:hypothetical protein